jgi:hypothetical protein
MTEFSTWIMPALDALAITLLAAVLWRLRRDPAAAWDAREQRLGALFEHLRVLAAQSEGVARDLDAALARRQEQLQALLEHAAAAVEHATAPTETRDGDAVMERVRSLAAAAMPIEEIARRVEMPAAEVRVLVGLHAARPAARARAPRAAATTAVRA